MGMSVSGGGDALGSVDGEWCFDGRVRRAEREESRAVSLGANAPTS
jgi:hypothetical protein